MRFRKANDKAVHKKFQMAKSASRSRSAGSSILNVSSNSQDHLLFVGLLEFILSFFVSSTWYLCETTSYIVYVSSFNW